MTISKAQAPVKLSVAEIIEAIKQLSLTERRNVWSAFNLSDTDIHLGPLPYVITLRDDIPIDEQLDEIWRQRGPVDWSIIDDIATKMDIQEPIEELLQSLAA